MPTLPEYSPLRTEIAGVPIAGLARQFGTPTFVYDAAMIRRRIADLAAFDVIRYAQKACSNLAILELMRDQGVLVDCVSAGEIRRALAAGYSLERTPPPIVYTADIFDRESLDLCVEKDIPVNCGSPDMIDQWGERSPGSAITLRINPGFGHGHSRKTNTGGKTAKHGIWHTQIADCLARAKKYQLRVTGLHNHIGSGTDLAHLAKVAKVMEKAAAKIGPSLEMLSTGGGLPTVYRSTDEYVDLDAYFAAWDGVRNRLSEKFGHRLRLETEPGRYLVAESGCLLAEIRAVKRQGDNLFYLVDAGFNNLARPILYGAYHPMSIARVEGSGIRIQGSETADFQSLIPNPQSLIPPPEHDVIVGGPLCESGDIFTQEAGGYVGKRRLPEAQVGDILVIECAGAYGFVMGSNYNSKPLAAEVLIDHAAARLIRRRQTFEEMIAPERC
jgi:diaminopimelate decarboxylase